VWLRSAVASRHDRDRTTQLLWFGVCFSAESCSVAGYLAPVSAMDELLATSMVSRGLCDMLATLKSCEATEYCTRIDPTRKKSLCC
jgi:hypothetical protein